MPTQTQLFENRLESDLVIDVEMYPERYVLKPGDVMQITYDHSGEGYGLDTLVWDSRLQIYLEAFESAVVSINGEPAESWLQG